MTISPALFPAVTVTVVRDRKIRTAIRTNQIAGLVTVPSWKKIKCLTWGSSLAVVRRPPCCRVLILSLARNAMLSLHRDPLSKDQRVAWQREREKTGPTLLCDIKPSLGVVTRPCVIFFFGSRQKEDSQNLDQGWFNTPPSCKAVYNYLFLGILNLPFFSWDNKVFHSLNCTASIHIMITMALSKLKLLDK